MSFVQYRIDRDGADRLLFLMHGYTAEQHHLASYVPLVDPDERFTAIAPRGPIDMPDGDGAAWWTRETQDQIASTVDAVEVFVADEADRAGVPLERCVVGGFSQGGFLAVALAGKVGAPRYGGVWAICSRMPKAPGLDIDLSNGDGRPALYQWGTRDTIIGTETSQQVMDGLTGGGWDLRHHGYDMAHSQTIEMMIDARDWLAGVL